MSLQFFFVIAHALLKLVFASATEKSEQPLRTMQAVQLGQTGQSEEHAQCIQNALMPQLQATQLYRAPNIPQAILPLSAIEMQRLNSVPRNYVIGHDGETWESIRPTSEPRAEGIHAFRSRRNNLNSERQLYIVRDSRGNILSELSITYNQSTHELYIDEMETSAVAQAQGLGRRLLQEALRNLPETRAIRSNLANLNREIYERAREKGFSHEAALMQTPAYRIRSEFGFTRITSRPEDPFTLTTERP